MVIWQKSMRCGEVRGKMMLLGNDRQTISTMGGDLTHHALGNHSHDKRTKAHTP